MKNIFYLLLLIISDIIYLSLIIFYNIININQKFSCLVLCIVKFLPLSCIAIKCFIFFIYEFYKYKQKNLYSLLMGISFIFCLIGDLFLALCIDKNLNSNVYYYKQQLYFIIGGSSFGISRILMIILFIIHPYNKNFISISSLKLIVISLFIYPGNIIFSIFLKINSIGIYFLIFIYILLIGTNVLFSLLRINNFKDEILLTSILAAIGSCLFMVSDFLLLYTKYTENILFIDLFNINI